MNLSVSLSKNQIISPKMELSVRILQMDSIQINEYLHNLTMENPLVDFSLSHTENDKNRLELRKMEWLESQSANQYKSIGYYDSSEANTIENLASSIDTQSLTDYLFTQIALECTNGDIASAARYIVGSIDHNGYLTASTAEIACNGHLDHTLVEHALKFIQSLEPAGLGASSLCECLCLQLEKDDLLIKKLLTENLDDVAKKRYSILAKKYKVSETTIQRAVHKISQLNPKPGSIFQTNTVPPYISPDIVVTNFEDHYNVMLCDFNYPEIVLNQNYLSLAKETQDPLVLDYINTKVSQINWVKKCIENRNKTLLSVAHAIVKCQERFFRYGPANLNILHLSDIAEIVGLHESTISRAIKDKYLQCAYGVYPLKHFLVKGIQDTGASVHSIKIRLKELVDQEDHHKPLSDQKLSELLEQEGTVISRRTVAKYREQLGIAKSCERIEK